jgi:hypothetical protein
MLATALVVALAGVSVGADPDGRLPLLALAPEETSRVVARWNSAVQHISDRNWRGICEILHPRERVLWRDGAGVFNLLSLHVGSRIDEERNAIIVYRAQAGNCLARIYKERRWSIEADARGIALCDRLLLGTMIREPSGPYQLDLSTSDDHCFGLDAPVADICLAVSPVEQTIDTWQDLRLTISLHNVSDSEVIGLFPRPSFYLQRNLAIGLINSVPPQAADAFRLWYEGIEEMSVPPVSGLLASIHERPTASSLDPGQQQEHRLTLRDLCWRGDSIPNGPSGTFELFVVYDAAMESDPVQAALPAWHHRVASAKFRVIVQGGSH